MLRRLVINPVEPEAEDNLSKKIDDSLNADKGEMERRVWELKTIRSYDSEKIVEGKQCWCLIDAMWMQKWIQYATSQGLSTPKPGPLKSNALLDYAGNPKQGLFVSKNYRGVSPIVYSLFKEIHGAERGSLICRWKLDIYEDVVPSDKIETIMTGPSENARKTLKKKSSKSKLKTE